MLPSLDVIIRPAPPLLPTKVFMDFGVTIIAEYVHWFRCNEEAESFEENVRIFVNCRIAVSSTRQSISATSCASQHNIRSLK
jgi:hypothetical protein